MDKPVQLLFVCLGNICRSPTAEAVMSALLEKHGYGDSVAIDSAGTGSWHVGAEADVRSREAASQRGINITSRARKVVVGDFDKFDYVLAMDHSNRDDLLELAPTKEAAERVHLFRSFDPYAPEDAEVPDPYYGGSNGFEDVLDMCQAAAEGLLEHLQGQHKL